MFEEHKFFCIICGRAGIPLQRNRGFRKGQFHRKKLYCPWCHEMTNCVEVRNLEEEEKFTNDFKEGKFLEEVEANREYLKEVNYDLMDPVRAARCR